MLREIKSLLLLLDLKLADLSGAFKGMSLSRLMGMLFSVLIITIIAALIYRFDLYVFDYLMGVPELGRLVIARFFELAFLMFFLMLIISTALSALSMLYKEDELSFLLSLPVSHNTIFIVKYFEIMLFSSWALIALTIPFILSYAVYFEVHWQIYLLLFAGLMLPLVIISGSLGIATALLIRWIFGGVSRRRLLQWGVWTFGIALALIFAFFYFKQPRGIRGAAYLLSYLESGSYHELSLMPHRLISRGLLSILEVRWELFRHVIITMLGLSALVTIVTLNLGQFLYYRSWLKGSDRSPTKGRPSALFKISFWTLERWISPIYRALFRKDFLEFRRYPLRWGQAFILFGFWALYVINVCNINQYFDVQRDFWQMLLFYANFSYTCFFTAALAGRFVFPIISLEGETFWVLKSAPLAMESFLWSKFWQAFIPLFALSGSMLVIGNMVLGVHAALLQASLLCIFIITIALTAISLGMGALHADFSQSNPMKIANSPGGMLCIFISLVFMIMMTTIFAWPTYLHYKSMTFQAVFPLSEWTTSVIIFIALGVVATLIPLKMGLNALNGDLKM